MTVRFTDAWRLHGFQALVLENRHIRVVVIPELGGKIWSIVSKRHDREMLWHHPRMPMRPAHYGATYDDWFIGGWDEVFPNDYPVTIAGERYPDHGEVWSLPARWHLLESTDDTVSLELVHRGIAVDTRFSKTLTLGRDEGALRLRYEVTNTGSNPLQVHWKMHPALPLQPGARLHLSARRVEVDPDFSAGFAADSWAWPDAPLADGSIRDLRALPDPDSGDVWFFYATELTAGSCAISYPDEDVGFGLTFDPALLSSVWVFASFGGWRGLQTIIIEPCTGYRACLDDAIAHGSVMTLQGGESRSTGVVMTVLNGEGRVTSGAAEPQDP
jgi:galactose mutarotase-like enzyme